MNLESGKEAEKLPKFEYLENKKSFLDEITFFTVCKGLSFGEKIKKLIKNSGHKLEDDSMFFINETLKKAGTERAHLRNTYSKNKFEEKRIPYEIKSG